MPLIHFSVASALMNGFLKAAIDATTDHLKCKSIAQFNFGFIRYRDSVDINFRPSFPVLPLFHRD